MTRDTITDRNRKARIREREARQRMLQLKKLDNITDAQIAALKQIKASELTGKPVTTASVADWQELRDMGAVREKEGRLILTSIGAQVASQEGA
jgi:hypothetical protein